MTEPTLTISNAAVQLGGRTVLEGVSLKALPGHLTALFGHNGAGKSTLLRAILGLVPLFQGRIHLSFNAWRADPRHLLKAGVSYLPQGRNVFAHLTVEENVRVVAEGAGLTPHQFARAYDVLAPFFPVLTQARRALAGRLSGGEAQQVALARAFICPAPLVLLDEPSVGLAPAIRERALHTIVNLARERNAAIVIAEHRIHETLAVSQTAYVLRQGRVALGVAAEVLRAEPARLRSLIA